MPDNRPRQSGSGAASSASSGSDTTSVLQASLRDLAGMNVGSPLVLFFRQQTSGFTTATDATTALFPSQPSSAPFSADATTTPPTTTTGTTSTPQTTTASASQSAHTSSTPTPASSSSSSSSTRPSSSTTPPPPTSTSTSPSSTPPPPTTSSPDESQSIYTSTYTTYEDGTQVVTTTPIPTTIPLVSDPSSTSDRTAIIAGSAAGGTALLILLLSLAFFARRKRFKRLNFLDAITRTRKQARTRESFLAGEDLDDLDLARPPLRYADYDTPWDGSTRALMVGRGAGSGQRTPGSTMPSRWSETGSAFKEEVWPPPNEGAPLMDPLANRDDLDLDLGRIVDDVMGPSNTTPAAHFTDQSISSMHRGSMTDSYGVHSRTVSNSSNAALLEAAGLGGPVTAPVRSSPLTQKGTTPRSAENPS